MDRTEGGGIPIRGGGTGGVKVLLCLQEGVDPEMWAKGGGKEGGVKDR